jgi:hypothetical protein
MEHHQKGGQQAAPWGGYPRSGQGRGTEGAQEKDMTTLEELDRKLDRILAKLNVITKLEAIEMAAIDDLLTEVGELDDINDSLDMVFAKLQELITAGGTDPAKLQEALTIITTQKARTKAAIVANTPAA